MKTLAFEMPPLGHLVEWPVFGPLGINKVVLVYAFAAIATIAIFSLGNKQKLVPTGMQNFAESSVEFVENQMVLPTMGTKGLKYTAYMLSLFFFIFFNNIVEIIPGVQMPGTARIALPMVLALLTYCVYHGSGFKEHGPFGYLKHATAPPGLPKVIYLLVVPIEFVSKFVVTPFSHTVRLFANLLAGHILLVTFTLLTAALWAVDFTAIFLPFPLLGVTFFVAFEVLVSFLQAYVFVLLTGVYIDAAISHEH
jgi:F-type H+-transporting ATPase subunit a